MRERESFCHRGVCGSGSALERTLPVEREGRGGGDRVVDSIVTYLESHLPILQRMHPFQCDDVISKAPVNRSRGQPATASRGH